MIINSDLCDPRKCDKECVSACQKIHGEQAPLSFQEGDTKLTYHSRFCTECLSCMRACKNEAISNSVIPKKTKTSSTPAYHMDSSSRFYEVSSDYTQFSESEMIFARVYNDSSFDNYGNSVYSGAEDMIRRGIPGYTQWEHEITQANWTLYDSRNLVHVADVERFGNQREVTTDDPKKLSELVKRAGKLFGGSLIGIAPLDQRWVYSVNRENKPYDIPQSLNRAIVIAIEMDYDGIATSPTFAAQAASSIGYSKMAFVEIQLSSLIRRMGYTAIACGNDVALSVPLAIDAGLGQYGRHGLLITKEFGPRVRLAKILTDMPLIPDSPDRGFCEAVIRFCETCKKCAKECPSQSISYDKERKWHGKTKSNNPGVKKWYVNAETCYNFWIQNGGECSNCIRSCPYNKPNNILHRMVLWMVRHIPWMNRLIILMDDIVGYGQQIDSAKFWKKLKG
ncbi:MAG: reductive dehalogenase [Candidatus Lokiarchaeota archaeon]|nr:reductive dehalogenase [Candidatus Lokiarchaeota archaeon]